MSCSQLIKGLIGAKCGVIATSGAEDDVVLVNFNDIDRTKSIVTDGVITLLILKTGAKGYTFTTHGKSLNDASASVTVGTYNNTWAHSVPLRVFTKNEDSKKFVNTLGSGAQIIAILKNKGAGDGGDTKYETYGFDNGLTVSEATSTLAMDDSVVYSITMASSDSAQEGSLPKSVFSEDLAATELMIKGITAA